MVILIKSLRSHLSIFYVPTPKFGGTPANEVVETFLRLESLVKVLMTGEDYFHPILQEQWLKEVPESLVRTMTFPGRIERMMKETNLPWCIGCLEFFFQPRQLLAVHI